MSMVLDGELLIVFHNGNSAQNSSIGKQYGIQKITNFWLINMMNNVTIITNYYKHNKFCYDCNIICYGTLC